MSLTEKSKRDLRGRGHALKPVVSMLLLVVVGQFVITPMVADLRVQGLTDSPRFGQLHGLASILFIATSVLGLVLVAAGRRGDN